MKIAVLGTRGFPGVQGGVETHCQELYPRLAKAGCAITVFTRRPYINSQIKSYENINLIPINCPKSKPFEAIIHTLKGIFQAKKINPDILHIHAVGPSLLVPLARFLSLRVVMTNHGPDYKRKKWGPFAKLALQLGEKWGSCWANEIICISEEIAEDIKKKYKKTSSVIPNGIEIPEILESDRTLKEYSLEKEKYILTVGRFVPEKGFHDLISAFKSLSVSSSQSPVNNWKLVIAGHADHEDRYSLGLKKKASGDSNIILTGFLNGQPLQELYSHAGVFVLPSYYEGLPIALLEAMSYGLLCLASDIPANHGIGLPGENYFRTGNIEQLSEKLQEFVKKSLSIEQKSCQIAMLRQKYDWDGIARKTLEVYRKIVCRNG